MIRFVLLLPLLMTIFVAYRYSFRHALVFVSVPLLILCPTYYFWDVPMLPDITFNNFMLAALLVALLVSVDRGLYRFHWIDGLMFGYVAITVLAELAAKTAHYGNLGMGIADARNLCALQLMSVVAPWIIGRVVARDNGLLVGTLLSFLLVGAFVGLVSPWEARMGRTTFDFLRPWWPDPSPWSGALYRFGLRRTAGPFAHPICQGFFFSMMIPLGMWLRDRKLKVAKIPMWMLIAGCFIGLALSGSRGPYIGALGATAITMVGWLRNRVQVATLGAFACLILAIFVFDSAKAYVSVSRGEATTKTRETAAYRNEMLKNYIEVVKEKPWAGYGKNEIPVVAGQKSIDNQYLFLSLMHGTPSALAFALLLFVPAFYLLLQLANLPHSDPLGRLGWALVGTLAGAVVTQLTVFAGTQTTPILHLVQGIAVGLAMRLRPGHA